MSEETESPEDQIPFTPVPLRGRRDGWTEARQRGFIDALARIGSVTTAARHVGKTRRSAYKLRERPGAESFGAAWDEAMERGRFNLHDHVIDRALNGAFVPRFYRGRQTGKAFRYYGGLAVAVLGGRGAGIAERLHKAEQKGAHAAYFNIERAWQRDHRDMVELQDEIRILKEKLKRLVVRGLIGPEWLDPELEAHRCPHPLVTVHPPFGPPGQFPGRPAP